jgi:mono/diheme cytochrome c family protein
MVNMSRFTIVKMPALLLAAMFALAAYPGALNLLADERPGPSPTGADAKLTEQQFKGQGLFLERCSLCHMVRALKSGNPPTIGPSLKTVFKDTSPDEEKDLRTFILNGTPHMPGFKYALSPKEIDDLIAYLKVM